MQRNAVHAVLASHQPALGELGRGIRVLELPGVWSLEGEEEPGGCRSIDVMAHWPRPDDRLVLALRAPDPLLTTPGPQRLLDPTAPFRPACAMR